MARVVMALGMALALWTAMGSAGAQDYPSRPIRFMIGFAPGGSADLVSRALAERLAPRLGQSIVPDNRVGASGVVANDTVAKAPPDGHTMVLLTGGHPVAAVLMGKLPYDALESFSMVSTVTSYPMMITVAADSPMKTLGDLIARARANPDKVTYAVSGPGSLHHLLGELINIEARTTMVSVPYRGAAAAMVDLLGGRIDAMVETATFSAPQVRGGKMRALALSTGARYPLMPEVPTIAETLPGIDVSSWLGLAVSRGPPRAIVERLNREVRAILQEPDMQKRLADLGGIATPSSPEEMRERIRREIARWRHVANVKNIPPTN